MEYPAAPHILKEALPTKIADSDSLAMVAAYVLREHLSFEVRAYSV